MEKLDGMSMDIEQSERDKLQSLFPGCFKEGKLDIDMLLSLCGEYVDEDFEKYKFEWKGKAECFRVAGKRSTGTLRPCLEESVNFDTTKNLYIEGDNLEVLKLLQTAYYRKVKMIYIDPPYNTGNDFVYNDNFSNPIAKYKEVTSQATKSNSESMGRFHTSWLNMMYPRLRLAANLLRDDGVIFISIDDNEVHNLRKICDEIFGEENFVGCAGRITKKANNKGDFWAPNFDYLLTYTKSIHDANPFIGKANTEAYNLTEEEGERKGEKYQLVRLYMSSLQNRNPEQRFWIECPDGQKVMPPGKTFPPERPELGDGIWRWTKKKFDEERDNIVIKAVKSSNLVTLDGSPARWNVFTKTYLQDVIDNSSVKPNNFIEGYLNQMASHELNALEIPFDYAKPSALIKNLMAISKVAEDDIVLDFFSGSATTAHAVMQLNAEDGGNCRFIMVQLPEVIDEKTEAYKAGYKTICEIGKERMRRAGTKIISEWQEKQAQIEIGDEITGRVRNDNTLDTGFKVLKLDTSNLHAWDGTPIRDGNMQTLWDRFDAREKTIKHDRTDMDIIFEVMLKMGISLDYAVSEMTVGNRKCYSIGEHPFEINEDCEILVCLDFGITPEDITAFCELAPAKIVAAEEAFADSTAMSNAHYILRDRDIEMKLL